jgi:hypothetical protein
LHGETGGGGHGRQVTFSGEEAIGIQVKRTIRQTLPVFWSEETFWDQMVRLIVQAALEERSGKVVSPIVPRRYDCELLNPWQPSCVFHL